MNVFTRNWHGFAYLILGIQAIAWLVAEIFLWRLIGYSIVVLMLILYFVHALIAFQDDEEEESSAAEVERRQQQATG